MMITSGRLLAAITTSLLMVACGGSNQAAAPQPASSATPAHGGMASTGGMCPMEVPGTQVSVADTPDGVATTFTTTGDVAQLRQRVHHMAEMHEHRMSGAMMGSGDMGSGGMTMMVPSTARAEDIAGGARIVVTPKDPAQINELRAHVHEHGAMMASGHCPMMEHRG